LASIIFGEDTLTHVLMKNKVRKKEKESSPLPKYEEKSLERLFVVEELTICRGKEGNPAIVKSPRGQKKMFFSDLSRSKKKKRRT